MNRSAHQNRKRRPTLTAIIEHRPPNPGRTAGGIGWEYVYPAPPEDRHENLEPCDPPARYAANPDHSLIPAVKTGTGGEGG